MSLQIIGKLNLNILDGCLVLKLIICPDICLYICIKPNINFTHNMYHPIYYCCNTLNFSEQFHVCDPSLHILGVSCIYSVNLNR